MECELPGVVADFEAPGGLSPVSGMLAAIGARHPDEEKEDCGFVYYARHFRSADGSCPPARERLLQHFEGVSILTLPCDSGTWGVAFVTSARDKELRALRAVPAWEAALSLFPGVAHWSDAQAITGVQVIAGIEDRHRRARGGRRARRHRPGRPRRRVGLHQPLARSRRLDRAAARLR